MLITNTFGGQQFDFGAAELSLQGPLSIEVSTGGRRLSQFDISVTTGVDGRSTAIPLNYVYNYDVGGQETTISGNLLIDADFSLNGFGFYELTVDYSSRQSVERNGQLVNDQNEFDSDFGPITIKGNLFTDALAMALSPLFERNGQPNPLGSLSTVSALIDADPAQQEALLKALSVSGTDAIGPSWRSDEIGNHGAFGLGRAAAQADGAAAGRPVGVVVPEPPVLILLLLGIPAIMGRVRSHYR